MQEKTGESFYEYIKLCPTFNHMLETYYSRDDEHTQASARGYAFEKMWDIIIKTGFCPIFSKLDYDQYSGNNNTGQLTKVTELRRYLKDLIILSKGAGGSSDITLKNKTDNKWVFISCKFYKKELKNKLITDYGIQEIVASASTNNYSNFRVGVCVKDKVVFQNIIDCAQATNDYIKNHIDFILDFKDLEVAYQHLRNAIFPISFEDVSLYFDAPKDPLILRFHQKLIVHKLLRKINEGKKSLLLGAKPRSGKTYCVGGLIYDYYITNNKTVNTLIITPAPNETLSQFTDDLFRKFQNFQDINIVEIKKGSTLNSFSVQNSNIIILSKQLIDDYTGVNTIASIRDLNLDFIIFDENHFHGTTKRSKNILSSYSVEKTIKLFLTATYSKSVNEWNIPDDCQFH